MRLLNTVSNWINKELLPESEQRVTVYINYGQILEGRKEKVKRLEQYARDEKNFDRMYRARHVLSRIEQAKFTIS
jgi:hypothetical protein